MYNILIAKYGEIGVKGKNRYIFENKLIRNIRNMLKPMGKFNVSFRSLLYLCKTETIRL